jgi:hypothetical protein
MIPAAPFASCRHAPSRALDDAEEQCLSALIGLTRLGSRVADVHCADASLAIALARAGRYVTTFETDAAALAALAEIPHEVRERITACAAPCHRIGDGPFQAAYAVGRLVSIDDPRALFARIRAACLPGAPIVVTVPNAALHPAAAALWQFGEVSFGAALAAFGRPRVTRSADGKTLCAVVASPAPASDAEPRVVALLRLTGEDRWLPQCLAALEEIADLIVTLDDNVAAASFALVKAHPAVVHCARRSPLAPSEPEAARALALAQAWQPDWVLTIQSSEVPGPQCIPELRAALRSAAADTGRIVVPTQLVWDVNGRFRTDVSPTYAERPRLHRPGGGERSERCTAVIRDYFWADPATREARALLANGPRVLVPSERDWHVAEPAHIADSAAVVPADAVGDLLARALQRTCGDAARVLCVDPEHIDAARIVATRWPGAASTAISKRSSLSDPALRRYDTVVRADASTLDLGLFFAGREYEAIVDFDPLCDPHAVVARLRRLATIAKPDGGLWLVIDESRSRRQLSALLAERTFFDAGLRIVGVETGRGPAGESISVVAATVHADDRAIEHRLTVVLPVGDEPAPAVQATYARLAAACAVPDVAFVVALTGDRTDLPVDGDFARAVRVYEAGIDAVASAAFAAAPAAALCLVAVGTVIDEPWVAPLLAALDRDGLGIVALCGAASFSTSTVVDAAVLAVATKAVHPDAWPRGYVDDRIRAAALAGIAARRGLGACCIEPRVEAAPPRRRATAERAGWEAARARRAGVPGDAAAGVLRAILEVRDDGRGRT